jgi:acyl transferase domain-containing protein/acyl carrier protein
VRSGESTIALAGGVNVILQPHISIAYSQSRMMASDGRCKFGDASGDGYVRSEGAGLVVLKPLARARADGDRIYAVIRGSALNNDGRSSGSMGTPSRIGQEELLRRAYADAGIEPGRVGYVEAHGTGTRVGDPVELSALGAILQQGRPLGAQAFVGSIKTNIGHTEGAAGVAGLIKAALALHHGVIPPSLHCSQPNPAVSWEDLPLRIAREAVTWPHSATSPRVAGVSAFGIAGTNAHVVLEEVPVPDDVPADSSHSTFLLPLSARSPEALRALIDRYREHLARRTDLALGDACWSAATRRTALDHRCVFVAADNIAMSEALSVSTEGVAPAAEGVAQADVRPRVAFVCPGQGAQWAGMARQLFVDEPAFRAALEECDAAASAYVKWSIVGQLHADPGAPDYRLDQIDVIQPVLVALTIAYARVFRARGIEPDAVVGHSMGEIAAAHIAGVLNLDQAMRIVCLRSALMRRTSGQGAMALVDLSMEDAETRLAGFEDRVTIAVSNSPRSSVISGDPQIIQRLLTQLEGDGIFCRLINVDVASHSPQMEASASELAAALGDLLPSDATCPIYSTVLARRADRSDFSGAYWGRNLRQPVRFAQTVSQMLADGNTMFLELGPHPVLLPSIQQTAAAERKVVTTIAVARKDVPEQSALQTACGGLWAAGYPIDWQKITPDGGRVVDLPLYPWQRERHWIQAAEMTPVGAAARVPHQRPDDESIGWLHRLVWEPLESGDAPIEAVGKWLILTDKMDVAVSNAFACRGCATEMAPLESIESAIERNRAAEGSLAGVLLCAPRDSEAAFLPIRVLQAILKPGWRSVPRLWCVTRGSQPVASTARLSVDQGALWGTGRTIAEEHPDVWGGLIDLDPDDCGDSDLLVSQLLQPGGEGQVAFRGKRRFVLRIATADREMPSAAFCWRSDASYLITGGLGDIGLQVARAMAARGARRLILLGRTPLPPRHTWSSADPQSSVARRIVAVRALEAAGVAVHLAVVDLESEAQLRTFLEQYAAEGWPPIRGVVHAAAALDNHLAGAMDRSAFDRVRRPKLDAAVMLDRLLPDLDLFVTFSSIVAYIGQSGEANYAAANAGLDALAHARRARGLPAVSIAWGVWANTGFARGEVGERVAAELGRQGIQPFAPDRGVRLFDWLCALGTPTVAVMPIDWAVFRRARNGRGLSLYRDLVDTRSDAATNECQLSDALSRVDITERRRMLERVVRESVGKVLKIAPAKLDIRKSLGSMGLTSLLALELRNRLEASLGRSLSATLAWNYPSVAALVEYLSGDVPSGGAAPQIASSVRPSAHLTEVLDLSDEEAALALRRGGTRRAP